MEHAASFLRLQCFAVVMLVGVCIVASESHDSWPVFIPMQRRNHAPVARDWNQSADEQSLDSWMLEIEYPKPLSVVNSMNALHGIRVSIACSAGVTADGHPAEHSDNVTVSLFLGSSLVDSKELGCSSPFDFNIGPLDEGWHRITAVVQSKHLHASSKFRAIPAGRLNQEFALSSCRQTPLVTDEQNVDDVLFDIERQPCKDALAIGLAMVEQGEYMAAVSALGVVSQHYPRRLVYPWLRMMQAARELGNSTIERFASSHIDSTFGQAWVPAMSMEQWGNQVPGSVPDSVHLMSIQKMLQPYHARVCAYSSSLLSARAGLASCPSHWSKLTCGLFNAALPSNHYALLAFLASTLPPRSYVVELGSLHGAGTQALRLGLDISCSVLDDMSRETCGTVVTYNVVPDHVDNARACGMGEGEDMERFLQVAGKNIHFAVSDLMSWDIDMTSQDSAAPIHWQRGNGTALMGWMPLCQAGIVFVDTNHHGDIEDAVLQWLSSKSCNFKGILVLDDVHVNRAMEAVWGSFDPASVAPGIFKVDASSYGHGLTGTGIVDFRQRQQIA